MAVTSSSSVVAFFSTEAKASAAIGALKTAGFQSNQIGAATTAASADAAGATTGSSYGDNATTGSDYSTTSKVANAASNATSHAAAATEGMWDKVKNFFEGNEEGGVEQYADERARDRSSHEITDGGSRYEAGDVSHSLGGMSVSDDHSRYFEHQVGSNSAGVLVTVTAPGREQEAQTILEQNGGDLGSNAASYDYGSAPQTATTGTQNIQLLGEVLRVHKDRVSRGEVRIRKEVITENQSVQVPVSREELVIERVPMSSQTAVHGTIGDNSEIRIPLMEEQASLDKQTVVREEVSVGKRSVENVQEVAGSVRHEELQVEDETVGGTKGNDFGSKTGL